MRGDSLHVVIVGGGVIGCSSAYYLARAGARVTLLERGSLCGEASCANAGLAFVSTKEGPMLALGLETLRLLEEAVRELETDFEFVRAGSLALALTEEEARRQQVLLEMQRSRGVAMELLDSRDVLALEPALNPRVLSALYCPADVALNPYALTLAFGRAARRLGAEIRIGAEVTGLRRECGRISTAVIREGQVAGDVVVMAAGAWSPHLTRSVGLDLPVEPSRGQIVVTEAGPPPSGRTVRDMGHIYARPTARGNYVIGSMSERVGFDKRVTAERLREYVTGAAGLVPTLAGAGILRAWAGLRPLTPDGLPLLGPVEGYEGLILATGHSRSGVGLSAATGSLVADLVTASRTGLPLAPFALGRFAPAPGH